MDRTALNYANLFDYQKDLNLHGTQFNYLSAIVYAGYFFGQYPSGWLLGRYQAQRVLAITCFLWGLMVLVLTQCRTYRSAMAVRFLMGMFEASVTPGLTLMTGWYYTRPEIPLRQCIWYSSLGFGGIVGSYISMGISTLPSTATPPRWHLIFYILGAVTMTWSFVLWFFLPDTPSTAWFLSPQQRLIAIQRVASNTTGLKAPHFSRPQFLATFTDPKTLLLFLSVFAAAIPNGVINSFSTIIIRDLGFSTTRTTQLKSVGDATQILALIIAGLITLNIPNTRLLVSTFFNILCLTSASCLAFLPRRYPWARLVAFWLTNSQSVSFTIALTMISSNMAGYTHRSTASAVVFTAYCWGNFAGPFVVVQSQAPEYRSAGLGLVVGYAVKGVCHAFLWAYLWSWNRRRDRTARQVAAVRTMDGAGSVGEGRADLSRETSVVDEAAARERGMRGETEWENKDFRYVT
jgi:sugar phosphate permease